MVSLMNEASEGVGVWEGGVKEEEGRIWEFRNQAGIYSPPRLVRRSESESDVVDLVGAGILAGGEFS